MDPGSDQDDKGLPRKDGRNRKNPKKHKCRAKQTSLDSNSKDQHDCKRRNDSKNEPNHRGRDIDRNRTHRHYHRDNRRSSDRRRRTSHIERRPYYRPNNDRGGCERKRSREYLKNDNPSRDFHDRHGRRPRGNRRYYKPSKPSRSRKNSKKRRKSKKKWNTEEERLQHLEKLRRTCCELSLKAPGAFVFKPGMRSLLMPTTPRCSHECLIQQYLEKNPRVNPFDHISEKENAESCSVGVPEQEKIDIEVLPSSKTPVPISWSFPEQFSEVPWHRSDFSYSEEYYKEFENMGGSMHDVMDLETLRIFDSYETTKNLILSKINTAIPKKMVSLLPEHKEEEKEADFLNCAKEPEPPDEVPDPFVCKEKENGDDLSFSCEDLKRSIEECENISEINSFNE